MTIIDEGHVKVAVRSMISRAPLEHRDFISLFGVTPKVVAAVYNITSFDNVINLVHLLWGLCFLTTYMKESTMIALIGGKVSRKTFQKYVWSVLESLKKKSGDVSKPAASERAYDVLVEAGIVAIVNCTRRVPCYHRKKQPPIRYCQVPVHDEAGARIETYFDGATTFIHSMIHQQRRGGSVLVHGEQGMSRSATIVMAYLMRYEGMTRDEAYIYCKKKRPMVNPNEGFWEQLKNYETKLSSDTTTLNNNNNNNNDSKEEEELPFLKDDWPIQSFALFTTCRELANSTDDDGFDGECKLVLSNQPIWKALSYIKSQSQLNQLLMNCLDFLWGRGILDVDIEWLVHGVLHYVSLYVPSTILSSSESSSPSPSCRQRIHDILHDPESEFSQVWSGEIYPTDVKRILDAMNETP